MILLFSETKAFFCFSFNKRSPKDAARKTEGFLHVLFLKNEEETSQKNLQSNVSQITGSPHAKVQIFLSTFKNWLKNLGMLLDVAFQEVAGEDNYYLHLPLLTPKMYNLDLYLTKWRKEGSEN